MVSSSFRVSWVGKLKEALFSGAGVAGSKSSKMNDKSQSRSIIMILPCYGHHHQNAAATAWPAFPSHEVDFWNRKFGRTVAITPQSWNDLPSSHSNTVTNRAKRQHKTSLECRRCMFINDDTQTPNLVRPFENEILTHYFSNDDDLKFIKVHISSSTVFEKCSHFEF